MIRLISIDYIIKDKDDKGYHVNIYDVEQEESHLLKAYPVSSGFTCHRASKIFAIKYEGVVYLIDIVTGLFLDLGNEVID